MMNMQAVEEDLQKAMRECPRLGLGVHLILTTGSPLLPASQAHSLITGDNSFAHANDLIHRLSSLDLEEVKAEWSAQIERFISITGHAPDHLDSHHHISFLSLGLFLAMLELAQKHGCAIRLPTGEAAVDMLGEVHMESAREYLESNLRLVNQYRPCHPDHFLNSFYGENATRTVLFDLLENLPVGTTEIMCHPGYADGGLIGSSDYQKERENELSILTDHEVMEFVRERNIGLIKFGDLQLAGIPLDEV
jgi:chitin disaccharide deacetylase